MKFNFNSQLTYSDRESKQRFAADKYKKILTGKVLDVGADEMYIKQFLPEGVEYTGIGLGGSKDLVQVDLENGIPFDDRSFDCVMCLDVLEHLENIHFVFDELCRVSQEWVIVSLPNPYQTFVNYLRAGAYSAHRNIKHYGLMPQKEQDRHRWFFSATEARKFVEFRAEENSFEIVDLFIIAQGSMGLTGNKKIDKEIKKLHSFFDQSITITDLYEGTHWWVLKKK